MKSYATYLMDETTQVQGLLAVSTGGVAFESFPTQSPIEQMFPTAARSPVPKINFLLPRAQIESISDLQGRKSEPSGLIGRVLRALHVEPNGLVVEVRDTSGKKRFSFDCAVSVYRIIAAYEAATP